ncbi:MAG: 16S rRNA (guanine(966)-N(2))-methyltransferase RsmD [Chloroflexota bacterium]
MSTLRVIGGKARGMRLRTVPGDTTRPITDRARESLFNILGMDIEDATLLDLFAGTGAVGIEALSRGAQLVRFIDLNRAAVEVIRANLAATRLGSSADVIRQDAFAYLSGPLERQYNYVFVAPPQYKELWKRAMQELDARPEWLTDDAWVIVQIHPVEYQALELQHLREFDQRKYGSVLFIFYERPEQEPEDL